MNSAEKSKQLYGDSYNCAQAVVAGCSDITGLDEKTSLAIAGAFGGGMRRKSVCGAVTGALMTLSLAFPFTDVRDAAAKDRIAEVTLEFQRRFAEKYGPLDCAELIEGVDNHRETVCKDLVSGAAEIVEDLIAEYTK